MGTYREYIETMKKRWIGRKVEFEGNVYTVEDVDYNGILLINKPAQFTETTAVGDWMIKVIE